MAKTSKPSPATDPARKQAVIYARVSSKEQEKEGFSIPAQLKLLKDYAAAQGFWPSNAPLGYRNVTREDGRKIIVPDETTAPIIRKMFEWHA